MVECPLVQRVAGEGGFGRVYLAMYEGDLVAIKTQKTAASLPSMVELSVLFGLESGFLGRGVDIVKVENCPGFQGEIYGIAMEPGMYSLEGKTVVEPRTIQEIAIGVLEMHRAGYLHLDIKPENILIGQNGHAMLTDFGLSRKTLALDVPLLTGKVGTLAYMAPEVQNTYTATEKSDVYSLGVTLLELMTTPPIYFDQILRSAKNISYGTVLSSVMSSAIFSVDPQTDPWRYHVFSAIIPGMLSYTPDFRPTMEQVVEQLIRVPFRFPRRVPRYSRIPEIDSNIYTNRRTVADIPAVYLERIIDTFQRYFPETRAEALFRALDIAIRYGDPQDMQPGWTNENIDEWVVCFVILGEMVSSSYSSRKIHDAFFAGPFAHRFPSIIWKIVKELDGTMLGKTSYDYNPTIVYDLRDGIADIVENFQRFPPVLYPPPQEVEVREILV